MKYSIIGNGIAGVCAAETIRQLDRAAEITLIGDETFPPYSRPMISHVLDGSLPSEKLPIRSSRFYDDLKIIPVLGSRVSAIDVDRRVLTTTDRRKTTYDKLLIATGADARPVVAKGVDLKNIFYMRTEAHIRSIIECLPTAETALVLGGGLVGFKAAHGLLKRGLKVTMLITSGYPLSMQVDETAGQMILAELLKSGLTVRVGTSVMAFEGKGKVERARLSDDSTLSCDMVIVGKGVSPSLAFVPKEKIKTDHGILVDHHLQTTIPDVFAAGDVAEAVDITRKKRWINAIWPEAAAQGCVAGANMAGRHVVYPGSVSRNVMRVMALDVMTLGLVNPPDDFGYKVMAHADRRRGRYRKLVFRDNVLVGAMLINDIDQGGILLSLIQNEIPLKIPDRVLMDPSFNFGKLIA
ncbi:MAG: NAD(P)/FAD-dependent oxidoreductase [Deltaproteobacteria bacterium]|nr:MAG: NAD(P)/FAD-dependent oxidoreductase [Deltaproteobacteria bacterium]